MKKIICISLVFIMLLGLTACKSDEEGYFDSDFYSEFPTGDEFYTVDVEKNPEVKITLSDDSLIVIELCCDAAPNAVASFLAYAKEDIYESIENRKVYCISSYLSFVFGDHFIFAVFIIKACDRTGSSGENFNTIFASV